MPRVRPELIQVIAAVIALAIGILVYLLDRPSTSVYLIPDGWSFGDSIPPVFGAIGDHLPTLAHTFAFILFSSALLEPWRWAALAACTWWWIVGSLFEVGQSDRWAALIATQVPDWFADVPLLENVADYFVAGQFDPFDLVSIAVGTGCAFVVVKLSHRFGAKQPLT